MKHSRPLRSTRLRDSMICIGLSWILGLAFLIWPELGSVLARRSYDWVSTRSGNVSPTEAAIISMDEASFLHFKQDPTKHWDRALHTRLLRELTRQGAKVIVFDIAFTAPSSDNSVDEDFAAAMRAHGKTVLAARVDHADINREISVEEPAAPVEVIRTNAIWGSANWQLDPDLVCRRFPEPGQTPLLASVAAELRDNGSKPIPYRPWLRFYGPPGTLPTYRYSDVLTPGAVSENVFRDKVVFVGLGRLLPPMNVDSKDEYLTPTGMMSGTEIQCTAFLNLVRHDWIVEASPLAEFLGILIVGLVLGVSCLLLNPWSILGFAFSAVALLGLANMLTVSFADTWFPWLIPGGIQVPFCGIFSFAIQSRSIAQQNAKLTRDHRELEAKLKSSSSGESGSTPGSYGNRSSIGPPGAPYIPDYSLLKLIGKGAYGEIWLARNLVGIYRAIKVLYRSRFDVVEPYEREFKAVERFMPVSHTHPGLVSIFHVGREDSVGYFYYVMDIGDDISLQQDINVDTYVSRTLSSDLAKRGRLPVKECLDLGILLADALEYLHQQKLIHRDIKPSNVIFVNGAPRFADVGLVTDMASDDAEVSAVGTPAYMAPEGPGTAASDVYSLGKLLYVAGMGRPARDFPELPTAIINSSESTELSQLNDIILKAASEELKGRFQSASELKQALIALRE